MNEIVPHQGTAISRGLIPTRDELSAVVQLGEAMAASGFFKDSTKAAQMVVKILAGAEYGLSPVQAATGIHIVEGKVTLSANTQAALIKRSGKYTYRVVEMTDERCEIAFFEINRPGDDWTEIGRSSFSMADAKKAGLADRQTWKRYPRNMLFARALSNGATWYCGDVFNSPVYDPDELAADVIEEPAPKRRSRRTQAQEEAAPVTGGEDAVNGTDASSRDTSPSGAGVTSDAAPRDRNSGEAEGAAADGGPAAAPGDLTDLKSATLAVNLDTGEVRVVDAEKADDDIGRQAGSPHPLDTQMSLNTAADIIEWSKWLRQAEIDKGMEPSDWDARITAFANKRGWDWEHITEEQAQTILTVLKGKGVELGLDASRIGKDD